MRSNVRALMLGSALICGASCLVGCDSGTNTVDTVTTSPEAKAADDVGQKGMMEYMQSKKGGGKSGGAPAPAKGGAEAPK